MKKDLHTHVAFTNNDQCVFYDDSLGNGFDLKYYKGGRCASESVALLMNGNTRYKFLIEKIHYLTTF